MVNEVRIPDLGDFKEVEVIDVLVKAGDTIAVDTPLITLETEKATMDVPSTAGGVVKSIAVKKGDKVSKGSVILTTEGEAAGAATQGSADAGAAKAGAADASSKPGAAASAEPTATAGGAQGVAKAGASPGTGTAAAQSQEAGDTKAKAAPSTPAVRTAPAEAGASSQPAAVQTGQSSNAQGAAAQSASFAAAYASPSVRKFARELGADLGQIKGSGDKARVTHDDVKNWVKQRLNRAATASTAATNATGGGALPKIPEVDFAKFGPVELKPLTRIQKISGPRLHASWVNLPHVTQFDEADITDLEDARVKLKGKAAKEGIKLTPLAFILRACVKALQKFPVVNSSLDASGQNLVLKQYINLGFATDTPNGLVVPVIRDAHRKDIYELARDLATLSDKAREGKLLVTEIQGGSFTVSSLGGIGGTAFTPIINAPEVAILGVSRSSMKPVYQEGAFVPRLMLPLSLSYDHRVVDGVLGVRFTTYLAQRLADVKGLLEAVP